MTPRSKSITLGAAHLALLIGLYAKYEVDRAVLPRVWVRAMPVDPDSLTRGRYVSLRVQVDGREDRVAFYIPEQAPDPGRLAPGEELWAQVSVPRRGPPRPIQLATRKIGQSVE